MKEHLGSSFDGWLTEEGILEELTSTVTKRVMVRQITDAMKEQGLSNGEMARRMHTSRATVVRLLDPNNEAVTLSTLSKAAHAVGRELRLELV